MIGNIRTIERRVIDSEEAERSFRAALGGIDHASGDVDHVAGVRQPVPVADVKYRRSPMKIKNQIVISQSIPRLNKIGKLKAANMRKVIIAEVSFP